MKVDKVADMEMDKVADMKVDMVAGMKVDIEVDLVVGKVANMWPAWRWTWWLT